MTVGVKRKKLLAALALATWLAAIGVGNAMLYKYSLTPGDAGERHELWPLSVELPRNTERQTLVMVAHPHCSCTRASIAELSRLMTRLQGRVQAFVLFVVPSDADRGWAKTDLWRSADVIEGVTPVVDIDGAMAEAFGSKTSGQTYLYDPQGVLRFSGGITPSRSHQGDSVGRQQIIQWVETNSNESSQSAVYGCSLEDDDAQNFRFRELRMAQTLGSGENKLRSHDKDN